MNGFKDGPNSWNGDITSTEATDKNAPLRNLGTSMSAISFGFVATAILISMFLIMAIFEHLVRQRPSFLLPRNGGRESNLHHDQMHLSDKLGNPQNVMAQYPCDVSVMMPGQHYPTFIAQPAPLPCPREGICWPPHDHHSHFQGPQPCNNS